MTVIIFALNQGCEEPEEVGKDLLPPQDNLNVEFSDSTTIHAYSYQEDSLQTNDRGLLFPGDYLLMAGSYLDEVFGQTNASFYSQLRMTSTNLTFGSNPVVDSVFLQLSYYNFYGDTTYPLTLQVHEITEDLHLDSIYYSSQKTNYYENQTLGSKKNFYPKPQTPKVVGGDTISPVVRIPIDKSLAQRFFNVQGTGVFKDNVDFVDFFKGIYVKAQKNTGNGSILYFYPHTSTSRLSIYYHNDSDTLQANFNMSESAPKYNRFDHDYSAGTQNLLSNKLQQLNNEDPQTDKSSLFIQSMGGINVKIKFPYLKDWAEDKNIALNKATLIVETDTANNVQADRYNEPPRLGLVKVNNNGIFEPLTDFIVSSEIFGGYLKSNKNEYRFVITRHIQEILKGEEPNNSLVMLPNRRNTNANRAALVGPQANNRQMRLELIYTKLDK